MDFPAVVSHFNFGYIYSTFEISSAARRKSILGIFSPNLSGQDNDNSVQQNLRRARQDNGRTHALTHIFDLRVAWAAGEFWENRMKPYTAVILIWSDTDWRQKTFQWGGKKKKSLECDIRKTLRCHIRILLKMQPREVHVSAFAAAFACYWSGGRAKSYWTIRSFGSVKKKKKRYTLSTRMMFFQLVDPFQTQQLYQHIKWDPPACAWQLLFCVQGNNPS